MIVGRNYAFGSFYNNQETSYTDINYETATYKGIGFKSCLLLGITFLVTLFMIGWVLTMRRLPVAIYVISFITTIVLQLIVIFKPTKAKTLSIPYAAAEGLILGCLCGLLEVALPGEGLTIAGSALSITLAIFLGALILYSTGIIKVSGKFLGFFIILIMGVGIFIVSLSILSLIFRLSSGISLIGLFYNSDLAMILCVIMCIVASFYVIMSLNEADNFVQGGYDKSYEWYAAFAILINVIYLFLEVLRLLLIIAARNKRD